MASLKNGFAEAMKLDFRKKLIYSKERKAVQKNSRYKFFSLTPSFGMYYLFSTQETTENQKVR